MRGASVPGSRMRLQSLPYDRYIPQTRPKDWNQPRDLLAIQVTSDAPVAPVAIPTRLRAIPRLDTSRVAARRVVTFSQGMINNRHFDFARVDYTTRLGATEIWNQTSFGFYEASAIPSLILLAIAAPPLYLLSERGAVAA